MIVSKNKLEKLIGGCLAVYCDNCPIEGEWTVCDKYRQKNDEGVFSKSCEEALLDWVQELDVAEALEEGAHIVNDQVVFPPVALPDDFTLNTPCDSLGGCVSSCPWYDNCPFEDD